MNLRRAALLLIVGTVYSVLYKVAFGFSPSLGEGEVTRGVTSLLWILAALTLMLFAYQFLRELSPRGAGLKYSLLFVIGFSAAVILSKIPIWQWSPSGSNPDTTNGGKGS